jgi:hypothetical protein
MGAEDFLVRIKSKVTRSHVEGVLAQLGFKPDETQQALGNERFWRQEGAEHIIEAETSGTAVAVSTTLRFAVCQPLSVDGIFADLVSRVASETGGEVVIAGDIDPDDSSVGYSFGPPAWNRLGLSIQRCAAKKRSAWQTDFGTSSAKLSCRDAIEHFIVAGGVARKE